MMRHCMMRIVRHHTRDAVCIIVVMLLLSFYLSSQNGGMSSERDLQLINNGDVAMETNSKNDRTRDAQAASSVEEASERSAKGKDGKGTFGDGGFGNILEGMDVADGDKVGRTERGKDAEKGFSDEKRAEDEDQKSTLLSHLQKLEEAALTKFKNAAKVAMVRGEDDIIARDLPVYRQGLERLGFCIQVMQAGGRGGAAGLQVQAHGPGKNESMMKMMQQDGGERGEREREGEGWVLLLCLAMGDADEMGCLQRASLTRLADQQKPSDTQLKRKLVINRIPGLRNVLWRRDAFCYTMNEARRIPSLRRSQLAPLCWVLPAQYDEFQLMVSALGTDVRWVFKSPHPGGSLQVLQPSRESDSSRIKQYRSQRAIVQQFFPNPLLIFGSPVSIRACVLVTSLDPLRAYVHSQGVVYFRQEYQRGFTKIPSRTWSLAQFRQYLVQTFGPRVADMAFRNMETVIVETLLVAEPSLVADFTQYSHPWEEPYRCKHCFQLLGFDIIFNSTLHPIVVEVTGQPYLQGNEADQQWASNAMKQTTVEESMAMLFSTKKVARDVAAALESLHGRIGIQELGCSDEAELCLTAGDLEGLLAGRREQLSMGSFRQLYPSPDMLKFSPLLQELQHLVTSHLRRNPAPPSHPLSQRDINQSPLPQTPPPRHSTKDLHPSLAAMELHYVSEEDGGVALEDDSRGLSRGGGVWGGGEDVEGGGVGSLIHNIQGLQPVQVEGGLKGAQCSRKHDTMPYLATLHTYPALNMTFDPRVMDYHATVPYEQLVIQVGASAVNCECEARLEDKFGVSRPANFTLGLGDNRINVYVVDVSHSEPWVLNTYTLHVQRQQAGNTHVQRQQASNTQLPLDIEMRHAVCSMVQDCDLPFLPTQPCGLRILPDISWSEVIAMATNLPVCEHGDAPGQWLVPCQDCSDDRSCDWERARWQPHDCQHSEIDQSEIRQCLAGKKLLFIGDSTNRGIMYYLMEHVNGSLYGWDKTHDTKLYTNINGGRTAFSFSYYPQFWLGGGERPAFESTLHQLMREARPLGNNTGTVLVVGGVHWLAMHHLSMVQQVLQRVGLTGIQKIVKGLGAGFHQPVDGIHCLTLAEQRKVYLHNRGLRGRASRLGFDFVDTFNLTMSRYRDFLEGKCACHFHEVEEVDRDRAQEGATARQDTTTSHSRKVQGAKTGQSDPSIRYHVTGRVNEIYSKIVLSQICGKGGR